MNYKKSIIVLLIISFFASCSVHKTDIALQTNGTFHYFYSPENQLCFYDKDRQIVFVTDEYTVKQPFKDGYAVLSTRQSPSDCVVINDSFEVCLTVDMPYVYNMKLSDGMVPYGDFYDGFVNLETFDVLEGKQFGGNFRSCFSEGYAVLEINNSCFFVDRFGAFLKNRVGRKIQQDSLSPFVHGVAVFGKRVSGKMKYGLLDKCGKIVLPASFDYLESSNNENLWIAGIKNGNEIQNGLVDKKGKWILKPEMYQLIELDDMVWAMQYENTGVERTHWKIVDFSDGSSIILSPEIRLLRSFPDNYIEYTIPGSSSYNRKGIMTCTGESIIEPEYDYIEKSGDFFLLEKDSQWITYSPDTKIEVTEWVCGSK